MGVGAGWYYDSIDGDVVHQNLAESLANAAFTYYHGPYATEAEAIAHKGVSGPAGKPNENLGQQGANAASSALGLNGYGLTGSGWSGWFTRGLKVLFGGILMILAVSHLTGASNAITRAAGSIAPAAAVA